MFHGRLQKPPGHIRISTDGTHRDQIRIFHTGSRKTSRHLLQTQILQNQFPQHIAVQNIGKNLGHLLRRGGIIRKTVGGIGLLVGTGGADGKGRRRLVHGMIGHHLISNGCTDHQTAQNRKQPPAFFKPFPHVAKQHDQINRIIVFSVLHICTSYPLLASGCQVFPPFP